LFCLYPLPPATFDWAGVGIGPDWPRLSGFAAHWEKNANAAAAFDQWFLNLFPRQQPFVFNGGGYQTLNFVPSLVTMIFGLLTGQLLRSKRSLTQKLTRLLGFGLAGVLLGQAIALAGLCPIVKRIWTPSWALYSGGWVVPHLLPWSTGAAGNDGLLSSSWPGSTRLLSISCGSSWWNSLSIRQSGTWGSTSLRFSASSMHPSWSIWPCWRCSGWSFYGCIAERSSCGYSNNGV
jgi:hypothetical protein